MASGISISPAVAAVAPIAPPNRRPTMTDTLTMFGRAELAEGQHFGELLLGEPALALDQHAARERQHAAEARKADPQEPEEQGGGRNAGCRGRRTCCVHEPDYRRTVKLPDCRRRCRTLDDDDPCAHPPLRCLRNRSAADGEILPRARTRSPRRARAREGRRRAAASATATLEGERKLVTVLFADLKGLTELIADRDPEEARRLLEPALEHMCDAVEKYGGTVSVVMGDGIMALFGAPVSWEDHAIRACHAALSMLDLVRHYGDDIQRQYGVPIQLRIGLNSGEVALSVSGHGLHMSYTAVGQPVHIAARMEQMAKPGSVLATAETVRLAEGHVEARPIGPVRVKGFDRPIEVAEIARLPTRGSRFDRAPIRATTPFIGRDAELAKLLAAFDAVVRDGAGRVAIVVGEPGIGKSRLVHEFLRTIARRDVLALDGGGAPFSGAGYRPGVHLLRQYFNLAETDDATVVQEKIAGRIIALDGDANTMVAPILALFRALPTTHRFFGLPANERRQMVFSALMWLGRRMAADRPLVLAYEDLQWVTADTRDFLDAFALELPPSTLIVLTYRSDYDAVWLMNRGHLEVSLEGLTADATRRMIDELLGPDASLGALKDELHRRSGGNPLFIEEYVRSMADSGELVGQPGAFQVGDRRDAVAIPPTVRAVLSARIDRLTHADKHVLQAHAAIGEIATLDLLERAGELPAEELRVAAALEKAGLIVERAGAGRPPGSSSIPSPRPSPTTHCCTSSAATFTAASCARSPAPRSTTSWPVTRCWARPGSRHLHTCARLVGSPPRTSGAPRPSPTSTARSECSGTCRRTGRRSKRPSTSIATCATPSSRSAHTRGCSACCRRPGASPTSSATSADRRRCCRSSATTTATSATPSSRSRRASRRSRSASASARRTCWSPAT
jgi:class 3 adenylate cyclase